LLGGGLLWTLLLASSVAAGSLGFAPGLQAQTRGPVQRSIVGRVVDKAGNGIKGAIVYLKDEHDAAVKTAIADTDGNFRFVQLASNVDYTVWAKVDDKRSANKQISSFDERNAFTLKLTIDK
jgi:hypothetical protein